MATTVTLQAEAYAFIDAGSPNSNSHSAQRQQAYYSDRTTRLLLRFARLPTAYRFRDLSNLHLHAKARHNNSFYATALGYSLQSFDAAAVTYNTRPGESGNVRLDYLAGENWYFGTPDGSLRDTWADYFPTGALATDIVAAKTAWIEISKSSASPAQYQTCELYTPLSSGNIPYLTVEVGDDENYLKPTLVSPADRVYTNPHQALSFSWANTPNSYLTLERPTQTRAVFYYRVGTDGTWQSYSVSGSAESATIPANTLPVADEIYWKIGVYSGNDQYAESTTRRIITRASLVTTTCSQPVNNYRVDRTKAFRFLWYGRSQGNSGGTITKSELRWSSDGGSTWQALATITGSGGEYTAPAGTFPAGNITWAVRSANVDGAWGAWSSANFTTLDGTAVATVRSPIGEVVDGSAPITFRWSLSNVSGWSPLAVRLWWKLPSEASNQWHVIVVSDSPITSYTVDADYFQAGETQWLVQAQNRDGVWGSQSRASFVVIAAPQTPSVATDSAPFATFNWQGDGQQAWRLTVDGKTYGPTFGTDRSFTLPDFLPDGEHTASVEIQGQYGLWSQPGQVTFTVENVPGEPVTLTGSFGRDAALSWITASETGDFLIYRDGVQIGHTAGADSLDRFVLGQHDWQVINRLPDGNYSASNIVSGLLRSCTTAVALFSGGPWLELALSENSASEQRFSYSRLHSLRHMRGAEFPVLEISPYTDLTGSYDCAFQDVPSAAAFEALKGQLVIIKSRGGNVVIGAITSLDKRAKEFYIAYTFTVQQCHWEDFVDDQDG